MATAKTKAEPEQRPRPTTVPSVPDAPDAAALDGAARRRSVPSGPEGRADERTSVLPPSNGAPSVQRAADVVTASPGMPMRARMSAAMQRAAGNARTGAMLGRLPSAPPGMGPSAATMPAASSPAAPSSVAPVRPAPPREAPAGPAAATPTPTQSAAPAAGPALRNAPAPAPPAGAGAPPMAAAPAPTVAPVVPTVDVAVQRRPTPSTASAAGPSTEVAPEGPTRAGDAGAAATAGAGAPRGAESVRPTPEQDGVPPGAPEEPARAPTAAAGGVQTGPGTGKTGPKPEEAAAAGDADRTGGAGSAAEAPAPSAAPPVPGAAPAATAAGPEAGGGGAAPDTGAAEPAAEGGGDEEGAADELEQKLEEAAPPEDVETPAEAAEAEPAAPAEAAAPAPSPVPAAPSAAAEPAGASTEPTGDAAAGGPEAEAPTTGADADADAEPAPETEPAAESETPEGVPDVDDAAAEAEPAQLSPAETSVAMGSMAEGAAAEPGGGGGGGGGAALPDVPARETPDVSALPPEAALATAATAPPAQLAAALGGVKTAVGSNVADQRAELAANPPTVARPAGKGSKQVEVAPSGPTGARAVEKVPQGPEVPTPRPEPLPAPAAPPPVASVPPPPVPSTPEGAVTEEGARRIQGSIGELPTSDPGLVASAGPAPQVQLDGNADPAHAVEQRSSLQAGVDEAAAEGRADAAADMGENDVHDDQPAQTLTASVGRSGGAATGGQAATGAGGGPGENAEAMSIIARQEKGSEINAAVTAARAEMAAKRQEHVTTVAGERAKSAEEIAGLEAENAREQDTARKAGQADVRKKRGEWTAEQDVAVREAGEKADAEVATGQKKVDDEKRAADDTAQKEIGKGTAEAEAERVKAEQEAARKKAEAEEESSGVLGWLASKAKAFFNKIKSAIKAAFDAARRLVKAAIDKAKQLAARAIEAARKAIVSAIQAVGAALMAIGDRLLKHFPALRDKFRKAIKSVVDKTVATVNKLAARLNAAIQKALDVLGAGLDAALGLLEKGLLAAVDVVGAAVEGALKFANSVIQALAAFAVLAKHVAANPGQWLRNLGAAVVDGIRNHLWKAFKSAVKEWFNAKVEEVLGLGLTIWRVLTGGGLDLAKIGAMAWEGIKSMIPPALIQILVEKLVSMIVPAAGAVMAIVEGLQAAWGSVSRILQAFSKFIAFLKAVRSGAAGPAFAEALAAAAIAVIDFVANWLLKRLAKGAKKVAGKLKGIARRLMGKKRLKAGRKKLKAAKRRGSARGRKGADGSTVKRRGRKPKDQRKLQGRLDRAVAAIRPPLQRLLASGVSSLRLKAQLLWWRVRYRLTSLSVTPGPPLVITATVNPKVDVAHAVKVVGGELHRILNEVGEELTADAAVRGEVEQINRERLAGKGVVDPSTGRAPAGPRAVQSPAAEAASIAGMHGGQPRSKGQREELEMMPGVGVRERQSYSSAPGHIETSFGEGRHGKYRHDIQQMLRELRRAGMSDADLRDAMFTAMGRRRPEHPAFSGPGGEGRLATLGAVTRLVTHVEPGRHPGAQATTLMGWSLLGHGDVTSAEVITRYNPMSPGGAGAEARASRLPEGARRRGEQLDARRHLKREIRVTTAYIKMLMRTEQVVFASTADCVRWIREKFKDHLLQRLRSVMWPSG